MLFTMQPRRERCPQRSEREAQYLLHRSMKYAENLPIEVKFSEGTPGTAFPRVASGDEIAMNGVGSFSIF